MRTAVASGWQFEWYDTWDEIWSGAVSDRWEQLLARDTSAHVYHDPRLVRAWAETHGRAEGARPMVGVGTDSAGRDVLVTWAVTEQRGRYVRRRSLGHVGDAFFAYHDPLVADEHAVAIDWRSFWQAARHAIGAGVDQALLRFVHDRYAPDGRPSERSPVLDLGGLADLDGALARCSANHRTDVRRRLRRIREAGDVAFAVLEGPAAVDVALQDFHERFLPSYCGAWRSRAEGCMFDRPGVTAFVERTITDGLRSGWAHYAMLSLNGRSIAWHIGLNFRRHVYWWIPAHDQTWQNYSPGKVVLALLIDHAIGRGASDLHLLTGAQRYKLDWRPEQTVLSAVRWHAPSLAGAALACYDMAQEKARR